MKKLLIGVGISMLLVSVVAAAAIWIASISTDITVDEAFSTTTADCTISALPGETYICNVTINNAASVPLYAQFDWSEDVNDDLVTYDTDLTKTLEISPGEADYPVTFTIEMDSTTGVVEGTVDISRVGKPI